MIRLFEDFSGYGSQRLALRNIGADFMSVGISEIDKYALKAYDQLHGDSNNFGDISKIIWENVPDFDLFTYSFPCTDISVAGRQKGLVENSGTRSSLLWECKRAITAKKPKYLLMENVKALVSKKFIYEFSAWQKYLLSIGYTNFTQVLNARDYGVAQNRERVFMVSILGKACYNFPEKKILTTCLTDYLEEEVDEKYYLSEKVLAGFKAHAERHNERGNGFAFKPNDLYKPARTILTYSGRRSTDNYIKEPSQLRILQRGRGFNQGGSHKISPTITGKSWSQNNVLSCAMRGRPSIEGNNDQQIEFNNSEYANCITSVQKDSMVATMTSEIIRRLTPRECFRLMGVGDNEFNKLNNISDTQLYKLAGNSIVVNVLEYIFTNLFKKI